MGDTQRKISHRRPLVAKYSNVTALITRAYLATTVIFWNVVPSTGDPEARVKAPVVAVVLCLRCVLVTLLRNIHPVRHPAIYCRGVW